MRLRARLRDRHSGPRPTVRRRRPQSRVTRVLGPHGHGRGIGVLLARDPGGPSCTPACAIKTAGRLLSTFRIRGLPRAPATHLPTARDADVLVVADCEARRLAVTNAGLRRGVVGRALSAVRATARGDGAVSRTRLSPRVTRSALRRSLQPRSENARGVFVALWRRRTRKARVLNERAPRRRRVEDLVLRKCRGTEPSRGRTRIIGVVIGATRDAPEFDLAHLGGPFLVPGVGAQGEVRRTLRDCSLAVLRTPCL